MFAESILTVSPIKVKTTGMTPSIKRRVELHTGFHSNEHKYKETISLMKSRVTTLTMKFRDFLTTDTFAEAAISAGQDLSASKHLNHVLFSPSKIKLVDVDPANAHVAWELYRYPINYLKEIHFCNNLDKDLVISVTFSVDSGALDNSDSNLIKNAYEGAAMLFMSKLITCVELESGIEVVGGISHDTMLKTYGWRLNLRHLV